MTNQGDASIVAPAATRPSAKATRDRQGSARTPLRADPHGRTRGVSEAHLYLPRRGITSRVPLVPLKGGFMKLRLLALLASCTSVAAVAGIIRVW